MKNEDCRAYARERWWKHDNVKGKKKKRAATATWSHEARRGKSRKEKCSAAKWKEIVDERLETVELVGGENYSRGSSSRKEGEGPGDERRKKKNTSLSVLGKKFWLLPILKITQPWSCHRHKNWATFTICIRMDRVYWKLFGRRCVYSCISCSSPQRITQGLKNLEKVPDCSYSGQ